MKKVEKLLRKDELEKIKKIMLENIEDAGLGLYNTRNIVSDYMQTLYIGKYFQLDICYHYSYFEVFGTTLEEFNELEKYYEEINREVL